MYPEGAQRLVRRDWSAIGLDYLKGPPENWTPQMVGEATKGLAVGLQQLVEEMSLLLGSRNIPAIHGYSVKFQDTMEPGATDAVLEVSNYPIPPLTNSDSLADVSASNGYAFKVTHGASCFDGPVCFEGSVTGIAGNGASVCWGKVLHNGVASDGTVGHRLGDEDTWESEVDVTPVTDKGGGTPTGEATRTVYLWRDAMTDPNLRLNDVIPFIKDENGDGISYAGRDMKIGAIYTRFDVADPTTPIDYTAANGHRGWRTPDGTNSTEDLGGQMAYGWKAGGDFASVGGAISASITGTVTDDAIVAAISSHAVHSHTIDKTAVTGAFDIDQDPANIQASTVTYDTDAFGAGTGTDQPLVTSVSDPSGGAGHSHGTTETGGGTTISTNNNASAQAHTASGVDAAVTATVVRTAGQVALLLQRVN